MRKLPKFELILQRKMLSLTETTHQMLIKDVQRSKMITTMTNSRDYWLHIWYDVMIMGNKSKPIYSAKKKH